MATRSDSFWRTAWLAVSILALAVLAALTLVGRQRRMRPRGSQSLRRAQVPTNGPRNTIWHIASARIRTCACSMVRARRFAFRKGTMSN